MNIFLFSCLDVNSAESNSWSEIFDLQYAEARQTFQVNDTRLIIFLTPPQHLLFKLNFLNLSGLKFIISSLNNFLVPVVYYILWYSNFPSIITPKLQLIYSPALKLRSIKLQYILSHRLKMSRWSQYMQTYISGVRWASESSVTFLTWIGCGDSDGNAVAWVHFSNKLEHGLNSGCWKLSITAIRRHNKGNHRLSWVHSNNLRYVHGTRWRRVELVLVQKNSKVKFNPEEFI